MYDTNLDAAIIWLLWNWLATLYSTPTSHLSEQMKDSTIYKSYDCKKKNWLIKFRTNYTGTMPGSIVILLTQFMLLPDIVKFYFCLKLIFSIHSNTLV